MDGILDSTTIIHLFRNHQPAIMWFRSQSLILGITSITWSEIMRGASSKGHQTDTRNFLNQFQHLYLTPQDQQWAMQQLEAFHFSYRIGMNDCLIGSVPHRLQIPLYTHNLKHMTPLLGNLAVKPY